MLLLFREKDLENDTNCLIVLKIKRKKRKWTHIVGLYRQCTGSAPSCTYNDSSIEDNLKRFQDMIEVLKKVEAKKTELLIGRDLNIDRYKKNNPQNRSDLKLLIPELESFLSDHGLVQINTKCTRHRADKRSTLLDVYFKNSPLKCSNLENLVYLTSKHEAVKLDFWVKDIVHKRQFIVVRNHRNLNVKNILEKLAIVNVKTQDSRSCNCMFTASEMVSLDMTLIYFSFLLQFAIAEDFYFDSALP